MAKGRGKQRGRGKKGKDKKDKRLSKRDETELERARANAALWEARLEVSEISRDGYREAVRRLAQCNEDLKRQQYKMEKDTMAVLSYIKRQDTEKDLLIEKLRQQLLEAKDKSEVDKEILQERYALKINELEGQYNQKTKEIGLIQIELKTIKQFQRRKTQIERELEEAGNMAKCFLADRCYDDDARLEREEEEEVEEKDEEEEEDEEKEEDEDHCLTQEAIAVFERLKDIDCPFLEGLYITGPKTIKQLLCTPSIYRLDIVEWMFTQIYPPFKESFTTLQECQHEEKIREMTKLGHELMLCGPDDQNLIKGSTNVKKQLYFFDQLMDLIKSFRHGDNNFFNIENFHDCVKKNEMLLRKFFSNSHLREILDPKLRPLPPDTKPISRAEENIHRPLSLPLKSRNSTLEKLSKKLNKLSVMLAELEEECSGHSGKMGSKINNNLGCSFCLTLSDFHQLVTAFLQAFENELWPTAPSVKPCGPLFQSVYQILTLCDQELKAITEVIEISKKIVEMSERQQQEKYYWGGNNCMMTLLSKMEELKQKHRLFKDILQKHSEKDDRN
ncbi:basal body-orientation factor 1 isoform X1 [Dromiciops gliroides]|uniref:basal body-orientation factor 1 isoform X1 n=1 Tax=Dromiciops gliroides TaxID=33562 RepID=UPI001CC51387|nr:basal body-orientation factor 1 isoform X1 [Dromiciops gliroides]